VVTEEGVAINPRRADLRDRLVAGGLSVVPIDQLRDLAERRAGGPVRHPDGEEGRVVAVVEYRDGTVIDVVRQVAGAGTASTDLADTDKRLSSI
jgi:citrate lyase subunit alpha/citrate CoA-transferase